MPYEAVVIALIVAVGGIIGQFLLRRQDFKRQDIVAHRVAQAAKKAEEVAEKASEAAELLIESNKEVARQAVVTADATYKKLNEIHILVDGNLTSMQSRELEATEAMLVVMREVVDWKRSRGIPVGPDADSIIEATQQRINVLARDLAHKQRQITLAAKQREPMPKAIPKDNN